MESRPNKLILSLFLLLTFQSYFMIPSHSRSVVKTLPGYAGNLPFKLETGYVGVGKKEDVQLFYYFVESTRNPSEDPLIFYLPGGPGVSALSTMVSQIGPFGLSTENGSDSITIVMNPVTWTQISNIVFMDIPCGTGFSYAETKDGWISSDNIMADQAIEFIKKFLIDHPKFLSNPLYVAGISYVGIVVPKITVGLYKGNELGNQPTLNIQGYILLSPLTDKFKDFNSRLEYARRMTLISEDIYKSATRTCNGNYVNIDTVNILCENSLREYEECTSRINPLNILDVFCDDNDSTPECLVNQPKFFEKYMETWANYEVVQQALNIRQGKIGKWVSVNKTIHYKQGENETTSYSYDIFGSYPYHKELSSRNCRALILSGDHDMLIPNVGIMQWITDLNIDVEIPWKPYYISRQVGGYDMKYAQNSFSLTFATVKGGGHSLPQQKPNETIAVVEKWLSSKIYKSDF